MEGEIFRAWKRYGKECKRINSENIVLEIKTLMEQLAPVPREMAKEFAAFYLHPPIDIESVYKADEILEILSGCWSPVDSVLDVGDWKFLKDAVNIWAVDMDMIVVNDVMRVVVEQGFSST